MGKRIAIFDKDRWNGETVIVYGLGDDGKRIVSKLVQDGVDKLIFCDKSALNFMENPVISPKDIGKYPGANFIIGSGKYLGEIYDDLMRNGLSNIFIYNLACYSDKASVQKHRARIEDGWYLYDLDFVVTEYCTLKCKNCVNGIPYFKDATRVNSDLAIESVQTLLNTGAYIADFCFIGGEPFLNQDLIVKTLEILADNSQIGRFITISNGTIVPKPALLRAMKKCGRFTVYFSDYGELSRNLDLAIQTLKKENIDFFVKKDFSWVDYGDFRNYSRSKEENQRMFEQCPHYISKDCVTLFGEKLSICSHIASGTRLKKIPDLPYNFIDLSLKATTGMEESLLKKKLIDFCYRDDYFPACEYCNRGFGELVNKAEQCM